MSFAESLEDPGLQCNNHLIRFLEKNLSPRVGTFRGEDRGIDGRHYFHDDEGGKTKQIILSVKSGGISVKDVRDLRGVVEREQAEIGVLITLEEPTKPMLSEAASGGFYKTPYGNYPKLQILTIEKLLEGQRIDYPPEHARVNVTFKKAPKARSAKPHNKQFQF